MNITNNIIYLILWSYIILFSIVYTIITIYILCVYVNAVYQYNCTIYYNETSHSKRSCTKICSSGGDFQEHIIIASLKK